MRQGKRALEDRPAQAVEVFQKAQAYPDSRDIGRPAYARPAEEYLWLVKAHKRSGRPMGSHRSLAQGSFFRFGVSAQAARRIRIRSERLMMPPGGSIPAGVFVIMPALVEP